ncbi:DUF368 domain-containing protein [Kineococcus terrestris]|uniref:DUF368 domain-containing protein n=1 Tax=Kineococcus terrestris TaxID=2044856 RepID=UPI0034DB0D22
MSTARREPSASPPDSPPTGGRPSARRLPVDVVRGALIGSAEVVPGVSGGTVALLTGVYETLIASASHVVTAARLLVTGPRSQVRTELAKARWSVVLPVLAGMAVAVVVGASVLEPLVTEHEVGSRAVFFGLVLASLVVPARMVGRWTPGLGLVAVVMAVAAFALTGLPAGSTADPSLLVVAAAAAVAICALVLPGVSGSFLLLTFGLYETTLAAVSERDLAYVGAFAVGATIGLASFVRLLQHLLSTHRAVTLAVMTGLMAGSLRALWPWQEEDRTLLTPAGPTGDVLGVVGLAVAGAALVAVLLVVERRLERSGILADG